MLILLGYLMRVAQVFRGKFFQLFFFFWFQTLMHCRLEVALLCGRNDRNFLFGSLFRFSYKYNSLYIFPRTISKKPNLLKIFPCQMLILLGYLMRVAQVFRGKFFQLFFFFWFQTLMHCRLEVALLCGRNDRNFLFGSLFRFSYKYNSLYIFPRTISVPQSLQISLSFTLGKIWYLGMGNIRGKIFMHILAQIRGYCNCYPS